MTTGLGDKVPEVFHEFDADGLFCVYLRALDRLPDQRVEVFFSAPEFEEEGLMIDSGTEKRDFFVRDMIHSASISLVPCTLWQSPTWGRPVAASIAQQFAAIGLT